MKPGDKQHLRRYGLWIIMSLLLCAQPPAYGGDRCIAATAVNFISPMTEILAVFEAQQGVSITTSYGSSGKLYGQLQYGAPYSLFLSADHKRPQLLHAQGLCGEPFHYTSGQVVLWSKDGALQGSTWQEALILSRGKIAMASPDAAPYGEKAMQALNRTGLLKAIEPQLIYGQSVGQTFFFAKSGGAQLGFIALSQALSEAGSGGKYWPIPEAEPVDQWGCIPVKAPFKDIAQKLQEFLTSDGGRQISRKYGYQ